MADRLNLVDPAARPAFRLTLAHQVAINALAALLVTPMRDPDNTPVIRAEMADALDLLRMTDAPAVVTRCLDAARALERAWSAPVRTDTAEARRTSISSAEWEGRLALAEFFFWRLAGASDALKHGGQNAA